MVLPRCALAPKRPCAQAPYPPRCSQLPSLAPQRDHRPVGPSGPAPGYVLPTDLPALPPCSHKPAPPPPDTQLPPLRPPSLRCQRPERAGFIYDGVPRLSLSLGRSRRDHGASGESSAPGRVALLGPHLSTEGEPGPLVAVPKLCWLDWGHVCLPVKARFTSQLGLLCGQCSAATRAPRLWAGP